MSKKINFKELENNIFASLSSEKEREILIRRTGLNGKNAETLEDIGNIFKVTRERIRQIERAVKKKVGESDTVKPALSIIENSMNSLGGLISFDDLSKKVGAKTEKERRLLCVILVSASNFVEIENDYLKKSWYLSRVSADKIVDVAKNAVEALLNKGESMSLEALIFEVKKETGTDNSTLVRAVIFASKKIDKDIDGLYGYIKWGSVRPKNTRDKAYIIFRKVKKPLHYKKLTELISRGDFVRKKTISVEAVHNELIKDDRFILVGRGLYALREWGFKPGVVADVIVEIMKEEGKPLHKDEVVKRVLEKRFVKKNTILLNLQEKPQFKRVKRAIYYLKD